jgi:hypothetical protein
MVHAKNQNSIVYAHLQKEKDLGIIKKIAMRQFCENEEGRKNKNDLKMFISKIVIFVSRPKNAFFSFEVEFSGRGSAESL